MRKILILSLSIAAGLTMAGCSQQTQDNAGKAADSAAADVGSAAVKASDAVDGAANSVGAAANDAGKAISGAADKAEAAADRAGNKFEEGADKARARVHEETAPKH